MEKLSRSQTAGLIALLAILLCVVLWTAIKASQAATNSSGIALREAFPQAPAAPPPVRPPARSNPAITPSGGTNADATDPANSAASAAGPPAPPAEIVVHVAGAVHKPGVYHLPPTARNDDALKAAGGPTSDANTDAINLAAHTQDGAQIYIPTRKEQPAGGALDSPPSGNSMAATKPGHLSPMHPSAAKSSDRGGKPAKLTSPSQGQININTAGAEELQRIPGIGPAMAERLIEYRKENHGFQSVEDLMQVSGIGQKKFEKMQPYIRVK